MKIEFFTKEVEKAQTKFNQVFGTQSICNLDERQAVIMAICWLGVLNTRIKENAENAELVREFIRYRNILNKYFNHKERREFNGSRSFNASNRERRCRSMSQLRECL